MFLSDAELLDLLDRDQPVITDLELGQGDGRYGMDAAVQPCSVDLTIGQVFIPEAKEGKPGSAEFPRKGVELKPGHTAVITTLEKCCFPSNIAAIGFPPNSVSSQGILMTNPGHVDPGYDDTMSFTVINMGSEDYTLQKGDKIVTLLLFEPKSPATKNLRERRGPNGLSAVAKVRNLLAVLSPDFLNVSNRVKKAATKEERKTRRISIALPIVVGVLAILATIITYAFTTKDEIHELRTRVETVSNVERLERRVRLLEREGNRQPPSASVGVAGQ
jgi:dCTP deaminase